MSWTGRHVLTVLICVLGIIGVVATVAFAMTYSGREKRELLKTCISQAEESPVECRFAVYGTRS